MSPEPPPMAWTILITRCLSASERLSRQLWRELDSPLLRWHLLRYSADPTHEHQRRLLTLMSPQLLLDASERLCAAGRCKRREMARFQEAVLVWTKNPSAWI